MAESNRNLTKHFFQMDYTPGHFVRKTTENHSSCTVKSINVFWETLCWVLFHRPSHFPIRNFSFLLTLPLFFIILSPTLFFLSSSLSHFSLSSSLSLFPLPLLSFLFLYPIQSPSPSTLSNFSSPSTLFPVLSACPSPFTLLSSPQSPLPLPLPIGELGLYSGATEQQK